MATDEGYSAAERVWFGKFVAVEVVRVIAAVTREVVTRVRMVV
jgi:hypothetical protein